MTRRNYYSTPADLAATVRDLIDPRPQHFTKKTDYRKLLDAIEVEARNEWKPVSSQAVGTDLADVIFARVMQRFGFEA